MPYVFISHATQADASFATRLANDLHAYGVRYWKAPECINPGERWPEAIERALNNCDTMVLVLTPDALLSRWVQTETDIAIEREHRGKMTFIPLDVKPCTPSLLVKNYQMVPFRSNYDAGLRALLRRLGVAMKKTTPTASTSPLGYDFYGLLGKNTGQSYFKDFLAKSSQDKKTEAEKSTSQITSSTQTKPKSIYEIIGMQPGLLGLDNNLFSQPGKKPDSQSADKSNTKPVKEEKKFDAAEFWKSSYFFSQQHKRPLLSISLDAASKGDKEKSALNYQKAIEHYTQAITLYPVSQKVLLKTDFLLGSMYHRRGECWMGLDFNNMMQRFNKTKAVGGVAKSFTLGTLTGAFGANYYIQSEAYKKAQEDFKKAKELGYTPPKKGFAG